MLYCYIVKTKILKLENIKAYCLSSELSDYIWNIVIKWNYFTQKTIGSQFVDSTDSIAANIAEGFGRYHKKDKIKFFYNARGSVFEAAHWSKKAYLRGLITTTEYKNILGKLQLLPKEINYQIKIMAANLKI